MTLRASSLLEQVTTRPVSTVLEHDVAPTSNLPVPVVPPPSGRALFAVADRLIDGLHEAARGKGKYSGVTWAERANNSSVVWGVSSMLGVALGAVAVFGAENPAPFLVGLVAGAAASVAALGPVERWAARSRAKAIPASEAEPYLAAFKSGDAQTQALVRQLASEASDTMAAHALTGDDFRRQLAEIAAVNVPLASQAARRVTSMAELARALPRRDRESVSCLAIEAAFERLEPEDRRELAPQLLSYLFRGERLRWNLLDPDCSARLRAALLGRTMLTSREELQKLVAPAAVRAPVTPDSGGDV